MSRPGARSYVVVAMVVAVLAAAAVFLGEPRQRGGIDPRAVGTTNELPKLTPEQAAAHTWVPDPATWEAIKKGSTEKAAVLTITGYRDEGRRRAVSRGQVSIRTSTDPVGAPTL